MNKSIGTTISAIIKISLGLLFTECGVGLMITADFNSPVPYIPLREIYLAFYLVFYLLLFVVVKKKNTLLVKIFIMTITVIMIISYFVSPQIGYEISEFNKERVEKCYEGDKLTTTVLGGLYLRTFNKREKGAYIMTCGCFGTIYVKDEKRWYCCDHVSDGDIYCEEYIRKYY